MLYQLKITLKGSKPPIWRKVWIRGDRPLEHLHYLIQFTFGWENCHLHQFIQGKTTYDMPSSNPEFSMGENAEDYLIQDLLKKAGDKLDYEYDFGDGWIHEVLLENVGSPKTSQEPMVIAGKRNGPPEDCGGVYGYANLLRIISDPSDPEHESMKEWVGEDLEPEWFDLKIQNLGLEEFDKEVEEWEKMANEETGFLF